MKITRTLYMTNLDDWRVWLKENHEMETEVWLVYYKKHTGKPSISYDDAVEQALCFGWIDSVVQRIDDEKYAQKFTPRRDSGKWSELNKRRVRKLIKEGQMTPAGLAKVDFPVTNTDDKPKPTRRELILPEYLRQSLMANKRAWENCNHLAPSYRRN
jgi:uncharacterized protein YdeI (YjbR/CyaY-like superfamily)